jgi:hypothetical protein
VLFGRGLCVEQIVDLEESFRVWCTSECDGEDSIMSRPWTTKRTKDICLLSLSTDGQVDENYGHSAGTVQQQKFHS